MPIPEDILKVERPKNTIVIAYGKDKSSMLFASESVASMLTGDDYR